MNKCFYGSRKRGSSYPANGSSQSPQPSNIWVKSLFPEGFSVHILGLGRLDHVCFLLATSSSMAGYDDWPHCLSRDKAKDRTYRILKRNPLKFRKCYTSAHFTHFVELICFPVSFPSQTISNFQKRLCHLSLYPQLQEWCPAHKNLSSQDLLSPF